MRAARRRRSGVILIVVLAMLTLFAIVGVSFVFYGQTAHPAAGVFREDAFALASEARQSALVIQRDILNAAEREVDFSDSRAALRDLTGRAEDLKANVRAAIAAAERPADKLQLHRACLTLEELLQAIRLLETLIDQLESGSPERA